jgi:metal-dependent amidase/aminoacylase/carboxypeptidase family protein
MIGDISSAIKDSVKKFHAEVVELPDCLAANPELSFAEYNSSRKIADLPERRGFSAEYPFFSLPTAFAPVVAGLGGVKLGTWWKWFAPLFMLILLTQMAMIAIGW